jgi:hypothetical protein
LAPIAYPRKNVNEQISPLQKEEENKGYTPGTTDYTSQGDMGDLRFNICTIGCNVK